VGDLRDEMPDPREEQECERMLAIEELARNVVLLWNAGADCDAAVQALEAVLDPPTRGS
jgi:hypothetical protein